MPTKELTFNILILDIFVPSLKLYLKLNFHVPKEISHLVLIPLFCCRDVHCTINSGTYEVRS